MKKIFLLAIIYFSFLHLFSQSNIICIIKTSLGNITLELYADKAPVTVKNFLQYVDSNLYDNTNFYRVCTAENEAERDIKIEVIQGGDIPEERCFEPIILETTNLTGINHEHGTISMARDAPNSATCSFFICINDQPELDFNGKRNPDGKGFAAFGKVIDGMDVVLLIQKRPNENQILIDPVNIISIARL